MPLYAETWPGAHILEKAPGEMVTAEWIVFNDGPEAFARLELIGLPHPTQVVIAEGPHLPAVPAGTPAAPGQKTLTVIASLDPGLAGGGPHSIFLAMKEVTAAGEFVATVRNHTWFLIVTGGGGGGGPVITAVGEPTIS